MSIESKHAYRFGYLKSEQWSTVRIEALAREGGKCQVCALESIHNDAHHIWYPENIYETKSHHLVILCRPCHDFVHTVRPECKTRDEEKGIAEWVTFRNAIIAWRLEKNGLFSHAYKATTPHSILVELNSLKQTVHGVCPKASPKQKEKLGEKIRSVRQAIDSIFQGYER